MSRTEAWCAASTPGASLAADPLQLPLASQSVDLVVLPHVLESHDHPHEVLRETERVLMPEGQVVISGFNTGSLWRLRQMFSALYEEEPRVSVDTAALPFYTFIWGDTFLGFHHGHKVKNESLPLLFAAQFRSEWGRTSRAYLHCGHRHHCDEKEYNGATVIQHPTLAARDAYAARGGWIAERAAQSITYSKRYGQVGRVFVTPEMIAA